MKPNFSLCRAIFLTAVCTNLGIYGISQKTFAQPITPGIDGTGTIINSQGNQFNIQGGQLSGDGRNLFHSFEQFGLSPGQIANFMSTPNIQNILGRITGGDPSIINGLIQVLGGNSNLFLMNPAGVLFGPNAQLNVPADFTVTTATGIGFGNDRWFNAVGDNNWSQLVGVPNEFRFDVGNAGNIVNLGELGVSEGSDISLIGGNVINLGTLNAPGGTINVVAIPSEQIIRISQEGHLLSIDLPVGDRQESNITPVKLPELLASSGIDHVNQLEINEQGQVTLSGSGVTIPDINGVAIASGTLNTSSELGGTINIIGNRVGVIDANLDASGILDGGTIRIGGDFKGNSTFPTADITYINENSILNVDATQFGDGGNVFIWSEQQTKFDGIVFSRGGLEGGNGGFIEISSNNSLGFEGTVDLSAPQGENGELLLDPKNVIIVDGNNGADDAELDNGEILAGDRADKDLTISEQKLEEIWENSDLTVEATNDITIEDLTDNRLGYSEFKLTLIADSDQDGEGSFSMDSSDIISTYGSVYISGVDLKIGTIDTFSNQQDSGEITLNSTNTIQAEKISTYSEKYSAGDITIESEGDVLINSFVSAYTEAELMNHPKGGDVEIMSRSGNIRIEDGLNTSSGLLTDNPGDGGMITVKAPNGNIEIGEVSSSVEEGDAGNIFLDAGQNIRVGTVLAFAETAGSGGNITLTAGEDINTTRISTGSASLSSSRQSSGGDVEITSNNGTVTTDSILTGVFGKGDAGHITISSYGDITTGELLSGTLSGTGGDIVITSEDGSFRIESGLLKDYIISLCENALNCQNSDNTITLATNFDLAGKQVLFLGTLSGTIKINLSQSSQPNPDPVATDPEPVVTDPEPVEPDPDPVATDPDPVVTDPDPVEPDPEPVATDPEPVVTDPEPVVTDPDSVEPNSSTDTIIKVIDDGNNNQLEVTGIVFVPEETNSTNLDNSTTEAPALGSTIDEILFESNPEFQNPSLLLMTLIGNSGKVEIDTKEGIEIDTSLSFSTVQGDGGDFTARTDEVLQTGSIDTSARNGDGGNINLEGTQGVQTSNLNTSSSNIGNGGNVEISSPEGAVSIENVNTSTNDGNSGNVEIVALSDIKTEDIDTSSIQGNGGNVFLDSQIGTVTTGNVNTSAPQGVSGAVNIQQGTIVVNQPNNSPANPANIQTVIQPPTPPNPIPNQSFISPQLSVTVNTNLPLSSNQTDLSDLDKLAIDLVYPNLDIGGLQESLDPRLEELDKLMTEDFSEYVKKDDSEIMTIAGIKDMLGKIEEQTGTKPAVVYALAHPDYEREGLKLEGGIALVLVTPDGKPMVKSVLSSSFNPDISSSNVDVFEIIRELPHALREITDNPQKSPQLKHLYQSLIAPLEAEMEARGIDTLLFSLDHGLRSIPLAMLHDGKQFLIEKYSIALIPSVTLTNSSYEGLANSRLLAMGASTFPEALQDDLPNVPLELEMITTQGWVGDRFLNEDFTLENMKIQRLSRRYDIVHLATHAEFSSKEETKLEFWDQTIQLDQLREFQWHKDPQVELLVLSACETAIGDLDAEMGFAGLAVRAGVKSSLATLWRVDDLPTMAFMGAFYQYLQTEPIKAEALRKTQLAMLRGEIFIENGELITPDRRISLPPEMIAKLKNTSGSIPLSSPFHWAGFTLVGSPW